MWCKDPFLKFLESSGFSTIRLPRRDFRPLQLLSSQKKDLFKLGELSAVMIAAAATPLPAIAANQPAASISGQRTGEMSAGIGLNLLSSVIGAMGGGTLGLESKYSSAKTLSFEFSDVLMDSIDIADLDAFLGASDVNPSSRHVATLLDSDDVYVLTATIKSNKITVDAKNSSGTSVGVTVPEIEQVVGGNLAVAAKSGANTAMTYTGREPLVFGFQAVRLFYDHGRYTAFEPVQPGTVAARAVMAKALPTGVQALTPGSLAQIRDI